MSVPSHDGRGRRLLDADQLAEELGRSKRWVYRQHEERGLPGHKFGRQLLFRLDLVDAWLDRHLVGDLGDEGGPPG